MNIPELGAQPSIPDKECDSQEEVFAFIGFSSFLAQGLEAELVNIAVAVSDGSAELPHERVELLFEAHERRTLGNLLAAVRSRLALEVEAEKAIEEAIEQRNRLIHRFFREHTSNFLTAVGRGKMIEDLRGMARTFLDADTFLTDVSNQLWALRGVTKAMRELLVQDMIADATIRDQAV